MNLLYLALAGLLATPTPAARDIEQEAARAVAQGRYEEAKAFYVSLEEDFTERSDYSVWVGRLSGWLHDYPAALSAYDRALRRDPRNVEALLGKADVLLWQKQYRDAEVLLARAEELAPGSRDVTFAWAKRFYYGGDRKAASQFVDRVLTLQADDAEALKLRSNLKGDGSTEITLGYGLDRFSFASAGHAGSVEASWLLTEGRVGARYEEWSRFDQRATRGGLTASRRLGTSWTIHGASLFGSSGAVFSSHDHSVGIARKLRAGWVAGADYRFLKFDNATVHVVAPSLEYYFERPSWVSTTFAWASTRYPGVTAGDADGLSFRAVYYHGFSRRAVLSGGYARGSDTYAGFSFDRTGRFVADTYIGGIEWRIGSGIALGVNDAWQRRSNGATQQSVSVRLSLRR